MLKRMKNHLLNDTGITTVEYAVLLAFITISLIVAVTALSEGSATFFEAACSAITGEAC